MKSSSSNSEKSTGISLRVFRGELAAYMAVDIAEARAAATDALLLVVPPPPPLVDDADVGAAAAPVDADAVLLVVL